MNPKFFIKIFPLKLTCVFKYVDLTLLAVTYVSIFMNYCTSLNCHKLTSFTPWSIPRPACQNDYTGEGFLEKDYDEGGFMS